MVEWVKDVESGEIFPVYNVREFDFPEHLKEVEVTEVDYDKTREKTILQLQEELTEAQERIKLMKATPISKEPCEDIIIAQKTYITSEDVNFEKVPKQHDLKKIILIVIACIAVIVFSFLFFKYYNSIPIETVEQVQQVVEADETGATEDINILYEVCKKVLPVAITIVGIRFAIKFMIITIHNV